MSMMERRTAPVEGRDLTAREIVESARGCRLGVRFDPRDEADDRPVAKGWYAERTPRPMMTVTTGRMMLSRNLTHMIDARPMLCFGVTLEGRHESFGEKLSFVGESGEFFAVSLREPTRIQTLHRAGEIAAMTGLLVDRDWFDTMTGSEFDSGFSRGFGRSHLDLRRGAASSALRGAATRIMVAATDGGRVAELRLEAAALDFLASALEILHGRKSARATTTTSGIRRMSSVRERLDTLDPEDDPTLDSLAGEFAMSVSSLSRHFRAAYGVSVIRYLAEARLRRARDSLERGELTIARAAHLAGYSSPSSFSVAFKRAFGVPPGKLA